MSFKAYRAIDLCIMTAIIIIGELILSFASNVWFKLDSLAISITLPILLIVSMRWGWRVVYPAAIGGLMSCLFSQISGGQKFTLQLLLISEVGTLTILFSLVWFKLIGKQKTKENLAIALCFAIVMYLLNSVGSGIATAIVNGDGLFACIVLYFTRNSITCLFAAIIIIIVRKLDGVFEDQKTYLLRLEKQKEQEKLKANKQTENNKQ